MYRLYRRKESPYREIEERMTVKEYESRIRGGEALCILDDMVLNVENFASSHPGG
jgi:hypothetical protein